MSYADINNINIGSNNISDFFSEQTLFDVFKIKDVNNFEDFINIYLNNVEDISELKNIIKDKEFAKKYCGLILSHASHRDDFDELLKCFDKNIYRVFFNPMLCVETYNYYIKAIVSGNHKNIAILNDLNCDIKNDEFDKLITYKGDNYNQAKKLMKEMYYTMDETNKKLDASISDVCLYGLYMKMCLFKQKAIEDELSRKM